MTTNTKIEWAHHTFNPWIGCTKVSPGCDNCYAEAMMDKRLGKVKWGGTPIRTGDANWRLPLKWDADARRKGIRYRVFCASLADVFDNNVPTEWRFELFRLIEMTPHLDWLLLTKRIGNAISMLPWNDQPWSNVWLGATVVNQQEADRDIPKLLATPAHKRFLSIEPMLGPIDLPGLFFYGTFSSGGVVPLRDKGYTQLDWVIVGGESGHNARPMHPEWARSLRDQCNAAGAPFFFKQWGEWQNGSDFGDGNVVLTDGRVLDPDQDALKSADRENPIMSLNPTMMRKVGKKAAGRMLDGREWNEVPT